MSDSIKPQDSEDELNLQNRCCPDCGGSVTRTLVDLKTIYQCDECEWTGDESELEDPEEGEECGTGAFRD